jgi:anti-sigma factor RsiW
MIAANCPSSQRICDYLLGKLTEPDLEAVSRHFEECSECSRTADSLDDISDSLLLLLRGLVPDRRPPIDAVLVQLLDKVRSIAESAVSEPVRPVDSNLR